MEQEQRLIDGLGLWAEMKRLEELARNRYLDTTSSSPAHTRYCEQMRERTNLKEIVSAMPTIDPVHAAGACYCRECIRWGKNNCLSVTKTKPTDFCSYGEPRTPPAE